MTSEPCFASLVQPLVTSFDDEKFEGHVISFFLTHFDDSFSMPDHEFEIPKFIFLPGRIEEYYM